MKKRIALIFFCEKRIYFPVTWEGFHIKNYQVQVKRYQSEMQIDVNPHQVYLIIFWPFIGVGQILI